MYKSMPIRLSTSYGYETTIVKHFDFQDSYAESSFSNTPSNRHDSSSDSNTPSNRHDSSGDSNTSSNRNNSSSEGNSDQYDIETSTDAFFRHTTIPHRQDSYSEYDSPANQDTYDFPHVYSRVSQRKLPQTPHHQSISFNERTSPPTKSSLSYICPCNCERENPSTAINSRYVICVAVSAVIFSVLTCSIASISLLYKVAPVWEYSTFRDGDFQVCVPCAQLPDDGRASEDLMKQMITKVTDTSVMCCARNSGQMSALLQLMMPTRKNLTDAEPPKQRFLYSPVSAHKHLYPGRTVGVDEPMFTKALYHLKISPNNDDNNDYVRNVRATNNSLQVMFPGWYLIYSSVYFKPTTSKPCRQLRYQVWGHFINRQSPRRMSTSGTLVQSAHTCCDNCTEDHHTSYTAGVFLLEAGDAIYVEVTGSGLVFFDGGGSYLGLVMLGSQEPTTHNNENYRGSDNNIGDI